MNTQRYFLNPPMHEVVLGLAKADESYSRKEALTLIWRHTHRDYRSSSGSPKSILVNGGAQGTILCSLDALTDEQVCDLLPNAAKKEKQRLARITQ